MAGINGIVDVVAILSCYFLQIGLLSKVEFLEGGSEFSDR